jgi:hypothetical protein
VKPRPLPHLQTRITARSDRERLHAGTSVIYDAVVTAFVYGASIAIPFVLAAIVGLLITDGTPGLQHLWHPTSLPGGGHPTTNVTPAPPSGEIQLQVSHHQSEKPLPTGPTLPVEADRER